MQKILYVEILEGEIDKIKEIEVEFQSELYNEFHKVQDKNMLDENPVGEMFDDTFDKGDGWHIEYRVKLGAFSWDLSELYENYNSMSELFKAMSELSLCENNDTIYSAYIEQSMYMDEKYAEYAYNDYKRDVAHAWYSSR